MYFFSAMPQFISHMNHRRKHFLFWINLVLTWNPNMRHKYHGGTSLTLYNSFFDWLSLMISNELSCGTDPFLPFTCTCIFWSSWSHIISSWSVVERNLQKNTYHCKHFWSNLLMTFVLWRVKQGRSVWHDVLYVRLIT